MEYDGFTVTFTASKPVTACATYHIKLAVADVGDQLYDSAVFLKANSFASGESFVVESYNAWSPSLSVMRGCTNYVKFCRTTAIPLSQPVPVELFISGTAVMGVDYSAIPTNFQIPAGQECVTIEFEAYDTGVLGDATIVLSFDSGCPCDIEMAEHVITLVDPFLIDASITGSGPICVGETTSLSVNVIANDMTYVDIVWSTGVEDVTTINVSPTSTTTYTCNVIYPCDTITLETTVVVAPVFRIGTPKKIIH